MTQIVTQSGRTKELPPGFNPERIEGLDPEGRIVVNDFDARNAEPRTIAGHVSQPFMFGLTLCCNAYDKGVEDGIVCRSCYSYEESGNYLYRAEDGTFPGLDEIEKVIP